MKNKFIYHLITNSKLLNIKLKNKSFESLVKFSRNMSQTNASLESAKRAAAFQAVDSHVRNGYKIGIGSGSTVIYAVERIRQNNLDVVCVPTSFQSKQLIRKNGLKLSDLEESPQLDLTIDGADEVDVNTLTLIKGGGGCLVQEKIVANASNQLFIIADNTKASEHLGQNWDRGLPIEVIPMAYKTISNKIETLLKGTAVLRMAKAKAGPVVTDNGNFIIDWKFDSKSIKTSDWTDINTQIKMIAGVVETGLFIDITSKVYFGKEDGSVWAIP